MAHNNDDPTAVSARTIAPLPMGAKLLATAQDGARAEYALGLGSCVVGAGKDADLILEDPSVSRRHVELTLVPEGVLLQDLGSRNGTFYLGQRVERMVLSLGSRVRLGSADLAIEADLTGVIANAKVSTYRGLVGGSPPMRQLFATLQRLEGSLVNVLVDGESGVGKELIARAIHEGSHRAGGPMLTVNCGAVPRELAQSELFGHKKGAFTGAIESRIGAFEAADGGTLFLDEIGELPLEVQPILLRALESGEIRAVGETKSKTVKVRLIAATNRDLAEEVAAGRFREDLYFRIAVVRLTIPALRDRREDIPLLAQSFTALEGAPPLSDDVLEELTHLEYRGNVRELRNRVQAYLALGSLPVAIATNAERVLASAIRGLVDPKLPYADQKELVATVFTRVYLEELLRVTGGNQSEASRVSGIDRGYIGKLIAKLGVTKK